MMIKTEQVISEAPTVRQHKHLELHMAIESLESTAIALRDLLSDIIGEDTSPPTESKHHEPSLHEVLIGVPKRVIDIREDCLTSIIGIREAIF